MDGERAVLDRKRLILAVDEHPFEVAGAAGHINRFCVLVPLMTIDGERIEPDPMAFPNRGRIWWLVRDSIPTEQVVPGSLWTGLIELAARWDPTRPDTDKYQAKIHDIQQGGTDLIEVLPVKDDHPDLSYVQRSRPLPWSRPTTPRVFLLGKKSVLGPLKAAWDPSARKLTLGAATTMFAGTSDVLRISQDVFFRLARVEKFDVKMNGDDDDYGPIKLHLTRTNWLNLDRLRDQAEVLDGSTDSQIINWATRLLGIPRSQAAPLKDLLNSLDSDDLSPSDITVKRKRDRLQEIAQDAQRVLELGEEVARELSRQSPFADLVREHADKLVANKVDAEIRRRQNEIEMSVKGRQQEIDALKSEHDKVLLEHRRRLENERAEQLKPIEDRLRELRDAERKLADRERNQSDLEAAFESRMERVLGRYRDEADRFSEDLLAQLPILHRIGFGLPSRGLAAEPAPLVNASGHREGGFAGGNNSPSGALALAQLPVPNFAVRVDSPARKYATIDEAKFLDQFVDIVDRKGFSFRRDDLINFHVSVKTRGLTILAGLSGTGKSSLPLIYAEALGHENEYLHIPVRPDWLDDRDLVGAFNVLAQRFEPSNSGLVERLIEAELDRRKHGGRIYLVCLDEMNLARVEHYFAQFLSVIELPLERRFASLFAPGLARHDDPYHAFQKVQIGENVHFLGTVNIDETTHFFSPKVLDRSQVVAFSAPDLAAPRKPVSFISPAKEVEPVSLETYLSWRRAGDDKNKARVTVLQINEILHKSRLGLGFRQFDRILSYVESAKPFFSEDQALDYQIRQIILPRLRPTALHFKEMLQSLRGAIPRERFPRAAEKMALIAEQRAEDDFFQLL